MGGMNGRDFKDDSNQYNGRNFKDDSKQYMDAR